MHIKLLDCFWDFSLNKFIFFLPVFSVQSSAPVDEVTRSIIHLLRQVIKHCHSLPKLGLIIPAVQAVFPASCSSPLTDQDIHPKEKPTYWSKLQPPALHSCTVKTTLFFFPPCTRWRSGCFPCSHGVLIFRYSMWAFATSSHDDTISPTPKRASCPQTW